MSSAEGVLDIDLGNSAMKYRCGDLGGRLAYHKGDDSPGGSESAEALRFVLPDIGAVTRVRISSVLGSDGNEAFALQVQQRWGVDCEFACSVAECAGVTNGYTDPASLGVDRWLALLAAYQLVNAPVLVVDLGTAATLDYVSRSGQHLGGFIVPGVQLMRRSLLRQTAAIRYDNEEALSDLLPGRQTRDAVERGVVLSLVQLITAELERFNRLCDHNSSLVLCGGDGERVSPHLECEHLIVADLVLDGLGLALP